MAGTDVAKDVSATAAYDGAPLTGEISMAIPCYKATSMKLPEPDLHVVAYDFGLKHSILRMLARQGCQVTVLPA